MSSCPHGCLRGPWSWASGLCSSECWHQIRLFIITAALIMRQDIRDSPRLHNQPSAERHETDCPVHPRGGQRQFQHHGWGGKKKTQFHSLALCTLHHHWLLPSYRWRWFGGWFPRRPGREPRCRSACRTRTRWCGWSHPAPQGPCSVWSPHEGCCPHQGSPGTASGWRPVLKGRNKQVNLDYHQSVGTNYLGFSRPHPHATLTQVSDAAL